MPLFRSDIVNVNLRQMVPQSNKKARFGIGSYANQFDLICPIPAIATAQIHIFEA